MIDEEILQKIKEKIAIAISRSGRGQDSVKLMAVSKTRKREEVLRAKSLGVTHFGENRVLEAVEKFSGIDGVTVDLIGQLQSNKVVKSVPFFSTIQSVDSLKLAEKISAHAQKIGMVQSIFLEQNCSGEESKNGFASYKALAQGVEAIRQLKGVKIRGLMTIAPFVTDETAIRRSFQMLRESFDTLKSDEGLSTLVELSMGMSGDYEMAIEEGSTLVRIGTSLFGARNYGRSDA